jgi:hypothetical protein
MDGNTYVPELLVVTTIVAPVYNWVAVIVTSGITAPVASVTNPDIEPKPCTMHTLHANVSTIATLRRRY